MDLFDDSPHSSGARAPLAERMRPRTLDEFVGQEKLLGPATPLARAVASGHLPSLVLWGPPGCGKTTLAGCLARAVGARLLSYSAVSVGVKELRKVMDDAARLRQHEGRAPVLFLDEIHRFNKAQQDALLPRVESGDITLIGATTENPSFEVNGALLSRTRVMVLAALDEEALLTLLRRALVEERGLGGVTAEDEALRLLAARCGGDARFALNSLELAADAAAASDQELPVDRELVERILADAHLLYDRAGEEHFNLASALQKSVRNSDVQAACYWLARMLEAGEDPVYVARRLTRMASEDIGLADPQALVQCVSATQAVQLMGMPECALALLQATVYCARAPKSNALEVAYERVLAKIQEGHRDPVPLHLRNAVSALMRQQGYGEGYASAHDDAELAKAMQCLPDSLRDAVFYAPKGDGE